MSASRVTDKGRILTILRDGFEGSNRDIADHIGIPIDSVRRILNELRREQEVKKRRGTGLWIVKSTVETDPSAEDIAEPETETQVVRTPEPDNPFPGASSDDESTLAVEDDEAQAQFEAEQDQAAADEAAAGAFDASDEEL